MSNSQADATKDLIETSNGVDEDDAFVRDIAKRLSEPGALEELRRKASEANDPRLRALVLELEAMTNMTPARRTIGLVTMLPDSRYPSPEVWHQAISLIEIALAKTGYRGDLADVWRSILDHYESHRKSKFLAASIAHCKWFSCWLSDQGGRDDDAAVFKQLGIDLAHLKEKERASRRSRNGEIVNGSVRNPAKSRARTGRRAARIDPLAAVKTQIREMKQADNSQFKGIIYMSIVDIGSVLSYN